MLWSQWFNWRNEYLTPPHCFCYTGKPSVRCLAWVCMVSFLTWLLCRDSSENLCHNLMCTSLEMRCVDRAGKFCSVGYRRFLLCISGYFLTTFFEWMVERIIRNSADAGITRVGKSAVSESVSFEMRFKCQYSWFLVYGPLIQVDKSATIGN